jgi:hypothetical protein
MIFYVIEKIKSAEKKESYQVKIPLIFRRRKEGEERNRGEEKAKNRKGRRAWTKLLEPGLIGRSNH